MKKYALLSFAVIMSLAILFSCHKGGGNSTGCSEAALVVTTDPTTLNSHVEAPAPGPDFPLRVMVTAGMPSAGVTILVTATPEGSTTAFYTETKSSTTANTNVEFNITNTPALTSCVVNITVTSKSCESNVWRGSYRYSMK